MTVSNELLWFGPNLRYCGGVCQEGLNKTLIE
jgi:hypothetical protein